MTALLSAGLAGLLTGLSFPPFNFSFLAWISFVPLLFSKGLRFKHGMLAGFVANLIIHFWIWKTFTAANIGFPVTFGSWLLMAAILSLYFGTFIEVCHFIPDNVLRPLLAGLVWVLLEKIRCVVLTGFPWALLAHTQFKFPAVLQVVSLGGEGGLSFLLIVINVAIADLARNRNKRAAIQAGLFGVLFVVVLGWGAQRVKRIEAESAAAPKFKVAILQGNIDQYQKWDSVYEEGIRSRYAGLVVEASKSKPDLILWPESALPGWFPNDPQCSAWVKRVVIESKTFNLIGAVTAHGGKEFNAAFLLNPQGEIVAEYDKQHLVPFGEYIPFGGFMKRWVPYLGQLGSFDAGAGPVLFTANGITMAPNICYEAVFGPLVLRSALSGAQVIVNVTNDGWFLDAAATEQHFVMNIFRALETGRPVVRAANTGISGVITPAGKVAFRSPLLVSGVYVVEIPLMAVRTIPSLLYSKLCHAN